MICLPIPCIGGHGLVGLALMALWAWILVDCLRHERTGGEKLVWAAVIVLAPAFGALLYLVVRRPYRVERYGR